MNSEYIYFKDEGLEFLVHIWEDELYFDVDYDDNLLLFKCGDEYHVIIDEEDDEDE